MMTRRQPKPPGGAGSCGAGGYSAIRRRDAGFGGEEVASKAAGPAGVEEQEVWAAVVMLVVLSSGVAIAPSM